MWNEVLVGHQALRTGATLPARDCSYGPLWDVHRYLAAKTGRPWYVALAPVPAAPDQEVCVPAQRLTPAYLRRRDEAIAGWLAERPDTLVLADDADVRNWSIRLGRELDAPLVGLAPLQRVAVVRAAVGHLPLPDFAREHAGAVRLVAALAPPPMDDPAEDADPLAVRSRPTAIRLPVIERDAPIHRLLYPEAERVAAERPRTRGECPEMRPCPWVGCRHNTYLELTEGGSITIMRRDARDRALEPWQVDPATSCSLDVAERGGMTLADVAEAIGDVSRERARQIEQRAIAAMRGETSITRDDYDDYMAEIMRTSGGMWGDLVE